ncbi:hypothetical protein LXL04_034325 [Taraxacum kok-saghyz]
MLNDEPEEGEFIPDCRNQNHQKSPQKSSAAYKVDYGRGNDTGGENRDDSGDRKANGSNMEPLQVEITGDGNEAVNKDGIPVPKTMEAPKDQNAFTWEGFPEIHVPPINKLDMEPIKNLVSLGCFGPFPTVDIGPISFSAGQAQTQSHKSNLGPSAKCGGSKIRKRKWDKSGLRNNTPPNPKIRLRPRKPVQYSAALTSPDRPTPTLQLSVAPISDTTQPPSPRMQRMARSDPMIFSPMMMRHRGQSVLHLPSDAPVTPPNQYGGNV